jgi:hypothetical protein
MKGLLRKDGNKGPRGYEGEGKDDIWFFFQKLAKL